MAFGDFTVVRSTVKRVLNSSGVLAEVAVNTPAFEFNAGGSYKGLLVEPAGTNVMWYSEQFDNAYWTKGGLTVVPNNATAPNNTTTADTLVESALNEAHGLTRFDAVLIAKDTTYTQSLWLEAAGRRYVSLSGYFDSDNGAYAVFDLQEKTVVTAVNSGLFDTATGKIETDNDTGLLRVSVTSKPLDPVPLRLFQLNLLDSPTGLNAIGAKSYAGDGVSGVRIWGAQLETGSVATSYIPTVASTVTRGADDISLSSASSLIGQTEGTIFIEVDISRSVLGTVFTLDDGDVSDYVTIVRGAGRNILVTIRRASASPVNIITSSPVSLGVHKIALAYKNADYALYIDGVSVDTSADTGNLPTSLSRALVSDSATYGPLNDSVRSVALFPTRLSNATLATLTTL